MASPAKRKAGKPSILPSSKRLKAQGSDYHMTPSKRDGHGQIIWPAPKEQIERARGIIKECVHAQKRALILPDKDADGLSSGAILHRTLTMLGLSPGLISTYFPPKGQNVHDESTKDEISKISPAYIFVLDQGSRKSGSLYDSPHTCLIIDHHFTEEGGFPKGSEYVTAHDCPPVATSSLLTFHICMPLHTDLSEKISWLTALGTHGDLGNNLKWEPPFPDMSDMFKEHTKKSIYDAIALVNAPRRSKRYNVEAAWDAVLFAQNPKTLLDNEELAAAQLEIQNERNKWSRTPPKFSQDATIAVLTISSAAQIHPLIATQWAGMLTSSKLEIVMCANDGYLPGKVNFSCRVVKDARARTGDDKVDIIQKLKGIVANEPDLMARLGESFARGHKEASGGIVNKQEWDEFQKLMGVGEIQRKKKPARNNTLDNYFLKAS